LVMALQDIRFNDGASYERMMGTWSRMVGSVFLDWLSPQSHLRWIDIGCGNGAFTEQLVTRCAPVKVYGIDPSEGQLDFARTRVAADSSEFRQGDMMALPFPEGSFDVAVMALVIFYASDPAKAVAEMVRVLSRGGAAACYIWDMLGGGSPTDPIHAEMREMGFPPPDTPSVEASQMEVLTKLWADAGLEAISTREIVVARTYDDFEDFWETTLLQPSVGPPVAAMPSDDGVKLKSRVRERLTPDAQGKITFSARANAIKGQKGF
jgi:ubiquinone/menaquinone biosynthesis C-methylase UbiE